MLRSRCWFYLYIVFCSNLRGWNKNRLTDCCYLTFVQFLASPGSPILDLLMRSGARGVASWFHSQPLQTLNPRRKNMWATGPSAAALAALQRSQGAQGSHYDFCSAASSNMDAFKGYIMALNSETHSPYTDISFFTPISVLKHVILRFIPLEHILGAHACRICKKHILTPKNRGSGKFSSK